MSSPLFKPSKSTLLASLVLMTLVLSYRLHHAEQAGSGADIALLGLGWLVGYPFATGNLRYIWWVGVLSTVLIAGLLPFTGVALG